MSNLPITIKRKHGLLVHLQFFFNCVIPKKLIVWVVATIALFMKLIDGYAWMILSGIYLGVNIIGKFNPNSADVMKNYFENGEQK